MNRREFLELSCKALYGLPAATLVPELIRRKILDPSLHRGVITMGCGTKLEILVRVLEWNPLAFRHLAHRVVK